MVDLEIQKLEDILRGRIGRFVGNKSKWCLPCHKALQRIHEYDRNAFLCGGAVRDILLSNKYNPIIPRDLDIVLGYVEIKKVSELFSDYPQRWNCYGGLSIKIKDWTFDIWSLKKTWAFVEKYVEGRGFSDFPKSTFLDIESVAVQLFTSKGRKREIYSKGFFEAILRKTIEINLKDNPNPTTCIVRSLATASKFKFAIGPNLAKYITDYTDRIDLEELLKLYRARYKATFLSIEEIYLYVKAIKEQLRVSDRKPVQLPNRPNKVHFQKQLWSSVLQQDTSCLVATK